MQNKYQIALPGVTDSLPAILDFIMESSQKVQLTEDDALHIRLAVEEVCVNVIEHGYKGMDPGTICLTFQHGRRQAVIRITDFGHAFEPVEPPLADPNTLLESEDHGGFGLHLIHNSVDAVNYEATESGNTLTLIKRL